MRRWFKLKLFTTKALFRRQGLRRARQRGLTQPPLSSPCLTPSTSDISDDSSRLPAGNQFASKSGPIVPFELQELIINLVDDRSYKVLSATLRSCALTCHAWFPRSRRRLYRVVELDVPRRTQLDRLVELIDRDPEVRSAVQELKIINTETGDGIFDSRAILLTLPVKLPCVTSLVLYGIQEPFPTHVPVLAGFHALTTLCLENVAFTSHVAFRRLLVAAYALKRLFVYRLFWPWYTHDFHPISYVRRSHPPLTHLTWSPGSMRRMSEDSDSVMQIVDIEETNCFMASDTAGLIDLICVLSPD